MKSLLVKSSLAMVVAFSFSTASAQETKPAEKKQEVETLASIDFSAESQPAYYSGYAFGGYGLEGEDEGKKVPADQLSTQRAQTKNGKDGEGAEATFDTTKLKLPESVSYDYLGWGCGGGVDLTNNFRPTDLSKYTISFDAKVVGTEPLENSKVILAFVLPDDELAKDDDEFDDVVVQFVVDKEFTLTNEFKSFSLNLKDDLKVQTGSVEALTKHEVKRFNYSVQAQGALEDIGKDNDNCLTIDNVKLVKKK